MTDAAYLVVRYVADPARNEPLNVGIVVWTDREARLALDPAAVDRVVREHPRLDRDALFYLATSLEERLGLGPGYERNRLLEAVENQRGYPVLLSEPRMTMLDPAQSDPLGSTVERLLDRVVRPRRRFGGGAFDPVAALERQLRPLLRNRSVERDHSFAKTVSGVERTADFFVNSGANLALDALRLDITRAEDIKRRADAEANVIRDVSGANDVRYVVYCHFSESQDLAPVNRSVEQILRAVDAEVVPDLDTAVRSLVAPIGRLDLVRASVDRRVPRRLPERT